MSTKYKATTTEEAFFITMTTVGRIGVFTMLNSDGANISRSLARICNPCPQTKEQYHQFKKQKACL